MDPKVAIELMCKLCARGQEEDIQTCTHRGCPLYQYRVSGRNRDVRIHRGRMVAIHSFCLDCSGGDEEQVKTCEPLFKFYPEVECPLWTRRSGKLFKENGKYPEYRGMPRLDIPIKPKQVNV